MGKLQITKFELTSIGCFSIFFCCLFVTQLFPFSVGECPSNVQQKAFSCFRDYSTQVLNMHKSSRKLFSGVDVETLRAFCSSYISAMSCIGNLKSVCPEEVHSDINFTLINLEGAHKELAELCHDDNIYEIYARHQTCFMVEGDMSEWCYERTMNASMRLMSRVDNKALDELCSDIKRALACIRPNIENKCGEEAGNLVDILVKPMIRGSTQCDYRLEQTVTDGQSSNTHKRPQSGQQGQQGDTGINRATLATCGIAVSALVFLIGISLTAITS